MCSNITRPSDRQTVRPSDRQTVRPSDRHSKLISFNFKWFRSLASLLACSLLVLVASSASAKVITAQCKNDRNLDQGIMQAAIDAAHPGDTVLILGKFEPSTGLKVCQLNAGNGTTIPGVADTRVIIKKSHITVTGTICFFGGDGCWTTIRGDVCMDSNSNNCTYGFPSDGPGVNQNRAITITLDGTGANTDNVIVANLRFQDVQRSVTTITTNLLSNICPCKTILPQLLAKNPACTGSNLYSRSFDHTNGCYLSLGDPNFNTTCTGNLDNSQQVVLPGAISNFSVAHNLMANVIRGPQISGAATNPLILGNVVQDFGEQGILVLAGNSGCTNLTSGDPGVTSTPITGSFSTGNFTNGVIALNSIKNARAYFPQASIQTGSATSGQILANNLDGSPSALDAPFGYPPTYASAGLIASFSFPSSSTQPEALLIQGNLLSNSAATLIAIGYNSVTDPFGDGYPASLDTSHGVQIKCNHYKNPGQQVNPWIFGIDLTSLGGNSDIYLGVGSFANMVKESHGTTVVDDGPKSSLVPPFPDIGYPPVGPGNSVNTNFRCDD